MITVTQKIDEMEIFNSVKDFLLDEEIELSNFNYVILSNLPKDVQRLIFAKIGTMLIDYAENGDF